MQISRFQKGIFFALCAAAINGTIGIFSKILLAMNMQASWIAFLKTILGCLIISFIIFLKKKNYKYKLQDYINIGVAAFFGIFLLFFFETKAYAIMPAANVVVILMAMSAIAANLAAFLLLKSNLTLRQWLGSFVTILGIGILVGFDGKVNPTGFIFSACAGAGYGLFTVLLKKYSLQGGMQLTRLLLLWGSIYLFVPASQTSLNHSLLWTPAVIMAIAFLAILPTIFGFICTTKAIDHLPPEKVQLLELSEPLFTAILAYIFLNEHITFSASCGAFLSAAGIYIVTTAKSTN